MASVLRTRFVGVTAEEASRGTIASWTGMLSLALVFVLGGGMGVRAAEMANLGVHGAVAFGDFVTQTVAARALKERFGGDGDLRGDALVVHECLFLEELTNGGAC